MKFCELKISISVRDDKYQYFHTMKYQDVPSVVINQSKTSLHMFSPRSDTSDFSMKEMCVKQNKIVLNRKCNRFFMQNI